MTDDPKPFPPAILDKIQSLTSGVELDLAAPLGADMTEAEALAAVETARSTLSKALDDLRLARGESDSEPCHWCDAPPDPDCPHCSGTGSIKKKYPWVITGVEWDCRPLLKRAKPTWVRVRPCAEEFKNQTYLGWLLGDMALSQMIKLSPEGVLTVSMAAHNPAIFVPELKRVIFGCESWWSALSAPADLAEISNAAINNTWYVMALKDLEASCSTTE